mgnify:CR=1 FL=1
MHSSENDNSEFEMDSDLGEEWPAYLVCTSPCKFKNSILKRADNEYEGDDDEHITPRLSKQPE